MDQSGAKTVGLPQSVYIRGGYPPHEGCDKKEGSRFNYSAVKHSYNLPFEKQNYRRRVWARVKTASDDLALDDFQLTAVQWNTGLRPLFSALMSCEIISVLLPKQFGLEG